jgi:hypothetical protein
VPEVYDILMKVGISENVTGALLGISNMMNGISAETKVLEAVSV